MVSRKISKYPYCRLDVLNDTYRFRKRISEWFESFLDNQHDLAIKADQESTILVVTHGTLLADLVDIVTSPLFPFGFDAEPGIDTEEHCLNTSITKMRCNIDEEDAVEGKKGKVWKGVVECWGEAGHLKVVADEKVVKKVVDDV